MSEQRSDRQLPPPAPEAVNTGRYGERLWKYKGEIMPESVARCRYEKDRADFWEGIANGK